MGNELLVLTASEAEELEGFEAVIETGLDTFMSVGLSLLAIRERRLYRQFGTFEDYCRERWHIDRTYGHRLMKSAELAQNLLPMGNVLPENERQGRPLIGLEPEEQREAWQQVLSSGETITAALVEKAAKAIRDVKWQTKKQERVDLIAGQMLTLAEARPQCPAGLFHVISVDPPWPYQTDFSPDGRRCANPYPEMSLPEIYELNMPAADDCVLFLWTTHLFLNVAFALMNHWGFDYKATLVWDKQSLGMGSWVRMQCEFCLMGVKGKPPVLAHDVRDILSEAKREHSRKPEAFYAMAERLFAGRKLDYFSREQRDGWEQFGNDTGKFQ